MKKITVRLISIVLAILLVFSAASCTVKKTTIIKSSEVTTISETDDKENENVSENISGENSEKTDDGNSEGEPDKKGNDDNNDNNNVNNSKGSVNASGKTSKTSSASKTTTSKKSSGTTTSSKKTQNSSQINKTVSTKSEAVSSQSIKLPDDPVYENTRLDSIEPEDYYGYQYLKKNGTSAQLKAYTLMAQEFSKYKKKIEFNFDVSQKDVDTAYIYYKCDYPQHFWIGQGGYILSVNEKKCVSSLTLKGSLCDEYSESQIKTMYGSLRSKVNSILEKVSGSMPEIERERIIHNYLVTTITYDLSNQTDINSHNMYGALVNKKAVCDGYAKAFQLLMREAGIQCLIVQGTMGNYFHAWNLVKIDGNYYHVDVTSDDPIIQGVGDDMIEFTYFNLSDAMIGKSHKTSSNETLGIDYKYPAATSEKMEYFNYYGLVSKSPNIDDWAKAFAVAAKNGHPYATIRFTSNKVVDANKFLSQNLQKVVDKANQMLGKTVLVNENKFNSLNDENRYICIVELSYKK